MLSVKFRFRAGPHRDAVVHGPPWPLGVVFINLTENCNQSCGYCYAAFDRPKQVLPLALVERVLDQAADMDVRTIVLTGGEPFCYPELEDVLRLCRERELVCKIASNGMLLDAERVEMLLRYRVRSLQISLDTMDPGAYSRVRGVGPETHGNVLEAIRRCVETNELHIAVSAVVQRGTRDTLADVMRHCHDHGVDTFTLYHVIPSGRAAGTQDDDHLRAPEFESALDDLCGAFVELPDHWAVDIAIPWAVDSKFLHRWESRLNVRAPCGCIAGKTAINILADGESVPCFCMNDDTFSCGNVRNDTLAEIWDAPNLAYFRGEQPIEGCEGCAKSELCRGGCRMLAYAASASRAGPDPVCKAWE
jgi:radical SAM protein with 4Fe4S-binding SPASM domain